MYSWLLSNLWRKARLVFALLIVFSAAFSPATPTLGNQPASQPGPPTVSSDPVVQDSLFTDPEIIVDEYVNTYLITDGLLYWGDLCWEDFEFRWDGYLRRAPSHGGAIRTLQTTTTADCATFWFMAADETGVYYVDLDGNQIEFRSASNPNTPAILYAGALVSIEMTTLTLDDTYIYWGDYGDQRIYRMPKDGSLPPTTVQFTSTGLSNVVKWYDSLFWLDDLGLWSCSGIDCTSPTLRLAVDAMYLDSTSQGLFFVEQSTPRVIHYFLCIFGCADFEVYTAPPGWTVYNTALGMCANGTDYCLYWTESAGLGSRLRRMPASGGTVDTIADNLANAITVRTDDQGVYFVLPAPNEGFLGRLPFDATEVQRDLQALAWEVTQGNQSLSNDTPLVAHKTTYVRLYPSLWGEHANFVEAALYGWRGVTPLPGSPLAPLDGTIDLDESYAYDRADPYSGYLFQLPDSWTEAGVTTLQAIVDPDEVYVDQWPGNNSLTGAFTFGNKPPVCDIFIPVRTNSPAPSVNMPNFWRMIDLAKRLWPVPDVWVYYQDEDVSEPEFCWKWGFIPWSCDGPFELDEGSSWSDWIPDAGEALLHIGTRAVFSDDPDECDDLNSAIHYVGMVYPTAPTGNANGIAYTSEWLAPASWVKMPPGTFNPPLDFTWPRSGSTLAHETSHNHERAHVNCPAGDPADPDGSYPYPACQLDDAVDPTHFGFDVNLRDPIGPTEAADYMSYDDNRWASDYTYKAMYNNFGLADASAPGVLASAAEAVLISANVNPELDLATLHYSWVYPTIGMSQNVLGKWEGLRAEPYQANLASPDAVNYHLRLLDAGGAALADYTLTPIDVESHFGETQALSFQQTFAAPAGTVARMELMADSSILVSRDVGTASPVITILQPVGGETFSDAMTISWQASDPDEDILLFNLQYSPDGGLTWKSIADEVIGNPEGEVSQLDLDDLGSLGASNGATGLIRVAASDGYHTTIAVSNAFTVQDQPPQPYIVSPELAHIYPAGENVPLRGGAMDPETGGLSGDQLAWSINGIPVGTGEENSIYGLAPGSYLVNLQATDPAANSVGQLTALTIGRLNLPSVASTPALDGSCEDQAYTGPVLRLLPDGNGNQAFVTLARTSGSLWACFSGMRYIEGQQPGLAGLMVDVNNSRDELAQPDDYAFLVSEDGTPARWAGNGAGWYTSIGLEGMLAQVSVKGGLWSAEFNIPKNLLNDWGHPIGIYLVTVYNWSIADSMLELPEDAGTYPWPYASLVYAPNTWAWTLLGTRPVLTSLSPPQVTAGGAGFSLTLNGEGFQDGAVAYFGATALPTTYISGNQLTAQVSAGLVATSKYEFVGVTNPDTFSSDPLIFTIGQPVPFISRLTPSQQNVGSAGFTLSVIGSGFADGAQIVWNGVAQATTFVDSGHLQAVISAGELLDARQVDVLVKNPEPAGLTSNIKIFSIRGLIQFLPVVQRGR